MCFIRDDPKVDAYRVNLVCLSACMIKLENFWTDLDKIWYGYYTIRSTLKSYVVTF
jgi:hypothetical protein